MFKSPAVSHECRPTFRRSAPSLFSRMGEALLRMRAINELNGLSDRHLKDIGVERREIGTIVESELQRLRRSDLTWHNRRGT